MFNPRPNATVTRAEQNRLNASQSTGPRTDSVKAISKLNAVKTGLTGRTVLLPTDDAARYEQHVENWFRELSPEGPRECALVQSIADAYWRTERIIRLEFALYAAAIPADGQSAVTGKEDELATYLRYERQLRNLSTQESRLRRGRDKDLKELHELQKERRDKEEAARIETTGTRTAAPSTVPTTTPSGFVFATRTTEPAAATVNDEGKTMNATSERN